MTNNVPEISITAAAKILGVSWQTANKWVHSGKLRSVKVGGRYRTTMEWIEAVAEPVEPPQRKQRNSKRDNNDGEEARKRIEARFGIKVSGSGLLRDI